jgi:hypothetical protein
MPVQSRHRAERFMGRRAGESVLAVKRFGRMAD